MPQVLRVVTLLSWISFLGAPALAAPERDGEWALRAASLVEGRGNFTPQPDLEVARVRRWRGGEAVHLMQLHRGVPVVGGGVIAHRGTSDGPAVLRSHVVPDLTADVTASLSSADAARIALQAVSNGAAMDVLPILAVLPDADGGRLVYRVRLGGVLPPAAWMVTVDGLDGTVLDASDLAWMAQGFAFDPNPVLSDVLTVELTDLDGTGEYLIGEYAQVWSRVFPGGSPAYEHLAVADEDGNFFHEPDEPSFDDPFPEVNVYYHLTGLSHFFEDVLGHEFEQAAMAITNYRETPNGTWPNAAYFMTNDGKHMLRFGQGAEVDFGYDGDAVAHEFGHAIIHDRTDLEHDALITYDLYGSNLAPGAIGEGIADYWTCTYHGDPVVGEYIFDAPRDLDHELACPRDVLGESHGDGRIVGGAAWELRETLAAALSDALIYDTLALLPSNASFADLARATSDTAQAMELDGELTTTELAEVESVLERRGLYACDRAVELREGVPTTFAAGHLEAYGVNELPATACEAFQDDAIRFDGRFQWAFTTPAADAGELVTLQLAIDVERQDGEDLEDDDLHYTVYARKDEMVEFEIEETDAPYLTVPLPVPRPVNYDEAFGGSPAVVATRGESSDGLRLKPDTTYYFAYLHMNCPAVYVTVTPRVVVWHELDDEVDGGCRCEGGRTSPGHPWIVAAALAVVLAARRRSA